MLDWVVAAYILECLDECRPTQCGRDVIAALRRRNPQIRFYAAHKVMAQWEKDEPALQAQPISRECVLAAFVFLWMTGLEMAGTLFLCCFAGLLRVGEGLKLRRRHVIFTKVNGSYTAILLLGKTKRGIDDKVVLSNWIVVQALWVLLQRPGDDDDFVFPFSYGYTRGLFLKVFVTLGCSKTALRTHGLRRGGATELFKAGYSIGQIAVLGRWAAETTCRDYISRGDVALDRARREYDPTKSEQVRLLARHATEVFTGAIYLLLWW